MIRSAHIVSAIRLLPVATLFACLHLLLPAQETVKVEFVKGSAFVVGDISENQARRQAINAAKLEALRQAGIQEHISAYEALYTSQVNNDFSQFFSSDAFQEIQGAVKLTEIVNESKSIDKATGLIRYEVTLHAEVIKYTGLPDPAFDAVVEGVKAVYGHGELLEFLVKTTTDAWLHVFNLTENESYLMFPNRYESNNHLKAGITYTFPQAKIDYRLEASNNGYEVNRLVFVFTKKPMQYLQTRESGYDQIVVNDQIFNWIYSITPDQRKLISYSFIIRK